MKLNKQIFGWLGASALLLTTACSNEMPSEPQVNDQLHNITEVFGTGSNVIDLTLNSETVLGTRADNDSHISDGSQVNTLFFEVYDLGASGTSSTEVATSTTNFINLTAVAVSQFPVTLRLAVDPDNTYRIAVWGQHTTTTATDNDGTTIDKSPFSFTTLKDVTVNYAQAKNNDELRDAFCATEFFEGGDKKVQVIMHRPFAQLNVGTSGADYKNFMQGNIIPNKTVLYSKMVVSGVANKIDVANDKITKSATAEETVATFDYNTIAAFWKGMPTEEITSGAMDNEELLKVKLNADNSSIEEAADLDKDNDGFLDFKDSYPTMTDDGDYLTENFRYMSMAYVLVPSPDADNSNVTTSGSANGYDNYNSTTLEKVEVYFAGSTADNYADGHKFFTVYNVPVHRNWRTNLIGGLSDTKDKPKDPSDDPDNPDDPGDEPDDDPNDDSSLFYNVKIMVNLCPIYFGEFSGTYDTTPNNNWFGVNGENFPEDEHNKNGNHSQNSSSDPE